MFKIWTILFQGHEIPFCIKMNHMKQANINLDSPIVDRSEFIEERSFLRSKCEFILKKKKSSASRLEVGKWRSYDYNRLL